MKSRKTKSDGRASPDKAKASTPKKLSDVLLLSLSVVFLIIGVDQIISQGFGNGYWAIMLALVTFFMYTLRRHKR